MSGWRLLVASVLCVAIVLLDAAGLPLAVPRAIGGWFLTSLAPGLALLFALRPGFVGGAARLVLAIPLSLAITALTALALDRLGVALTPPSLMVAGILATSALLAIGLARDGEAVRSGRRHPGPAGPTADLVAGHGPGRAADPARSASRDDAMGADDHPRAADPAVPATSDGTPGSAGVVPVSRVGPGDRIGDIRRAAVAHIREPLFLHAYALGLSGLVTSGLGVVYWAVAARAYPPEVVGVNAALLSIVVLLANVSQLNLRSGFGRFVPIAGPRLGALLAWGYGAALGLAALTSVAFVGLLAVIPGLMADVVLTPMVAILFPVAVVSWTASLIQDHALTALRRTVWVPIENAIFALAKIGLLVAFAIPLASALFDHLAILASWTVATVPIVLVVSGWIFLVGAPGRIRTGRRADIAAGSHGATDASGHDGSGVSLREVVAYLGPDYLGSLFSIGSASLLPMLVLATLGASESAYFYIVFLVASAAQLMPTVLTTSLLVEASASEARFDRDAPRVIRLLAVVLGPLVVVLVLGAPFILGFFGSAYAAEGTTALQLLALAGIPYAFIQVALIRLRLEQRVRRILVIQAVLAVSLIAGSLALLPVMGIAATGFVSLVTQGIVAAVLIRTELWAVIPVGRLGSALARWSSRAPARSVAPFAGERRARTREPSIARERALSEPQRSTSRGLPQRTRTRRPLPPP